MVKVVKMCDMPSYVAAMVFEALNPKTVRADIGGDEPIIITNTEPKDLIYPEGWYYAKGCFRNKHTSTTGDYYEVGMTMADGTQWKERATYCTLP